MEERGFSGKLLKNVSKNWFISILSCFYLRDGPFCFIFIFFGRGRWGQIRKNSCSTFTEEI